MVQNITKEGFIKFVPLGGWWPHTLLAQGVHLFLFLANFLDGVERIAFVRRQHFGRQLVCAELYLRRRQSVLVRHPLDVHELKRVALVIEVLLEEETHVILFHLLANGALYMGELRWT